MAEVLLSLEHITKSFPGVRALNDVSLEIARAEVHALVGENGAGKSTLMKILTGAITKDGGTIRIDGREVAIQQPSDALALGISMIHQELNLIPYLDIGQNIYLGREPVAAGGRIAWSQLYADAGQQLRLIGMDLDPRTIVSELSIAQQQMVEIAKALSRQARLIAMDEPTSALTDRETELLFDLIRKLRGQGVTVIYISHRMEEIYAMADRVTVLRDGAWVGTHAIGEVTHAELVHLMVGREIGELYPKEASERRQTVLSVRGLSGSYLHDINFELAGGEILALAGLVGAGRTTLARSLFGAEPLSAGEICVDGQTAKIDSPQAAIRHRMGLVPEDRKEQALFLNMAVGENITMSGLPQVSRGGFLDLRRMRQIGQQYVETLGIRTPSLRQRVRNLSGGNQQKVVIARWLMLDPRILILDEPTRGIDVGAKAEIYGLMSRLSQRGVGILMISSDLPEVLGVSDRILVMREGTLVAEFTHANATQEAIIMAATTAAGRPETQN